ncbi:hypothetical protein N7472_005241 [Penicillium cf. griseofulvum]|uniref:Uncharacterized protein n=1 Tax=Penicillium cf. griseofulvum TaxID=2972120 RepID=A0A9W9JQN6_9EURO|nr:hypothetical protein N7472_005241 [Penicillium cf. griseofulvum]
MSNALRLTVASLTSSPLSRLRRSTVSDASVSDPDDTNSKAAISELEVAILGGLPGGSATTGPGEGPAPKSPVLAAPAAILAAPAPPVLPPIGPIITAAPPTAERDAYSAAQVKSAKDGIDGGFARLDPVRTEIDWRSARPSDKRCAKTSNSIRYLLGSVATAPAPSPAAPAKGKARTGKGKGRADKTPAAHTAPTAAPAVPATPPTALKRKAAESGRASADKKSKYARPPTAKMVAPKYSPTYNSRWYNSPLEVPTIAKLAFEDASVDAYETLKLAYERAAYDLSVIKKVLLKKGLIDDSDAGEGNDGTSESSKDPFAAAAKS